MRGFVIFLLSIGASGLWAGLPEFRHDIAAAEKQAKQAKKPILYDFGAIWCPPCNELKETVFGSPAFLEKAKAFSLIEVDVDRQDSWAVKDRYKVGGYPTVVFTDANGKEIYRVIGYRTPKEFLRAMDLVLASKNSDFSKACKSSQTDEIWRCAVVCSERKDTKCAEAAYHKLEKKLTPASLQYQDARTYFVEHAANEDLKRDGYERLLAEMPASPRAIFWADEYLGLFQSTSPAKPKKDLVEKVLVSYALATQDPSRDAAGFSITDMAQAKAEVLEKLGRGDDAKAAWKEASQLLEKEAAQLPAGAPARGFNIERIDCLEQAGEIDSALKLAQEFRAKYAQEFTFHYKAASMLYRAKRYDEALPIAKKAFETAYGDNKIRVATLLVNLYATVPDRDSARKVYDEVTHEIKPNKELDVRTPRYLKALDEALAKLPGSKGA